MDIRRPTTTTEVRSLIDMVQYYRDMCPRRSHVLDTLAYAAIGPKGRKTSWDYALEKNPKELKNMVSAKMLLSYPDWKIPFTVHTDASDK